MHKKKSDYALNKLDQEAIVYIDAEGKSYRLTCEEFLSEEEFLRWKKWSDENYHEVEKNQHKEDNHTVPLTMDIEVMPDKGILASESYEDEETILLRWKDRLTEKQFHRLWMLVIEHLSVNEIAKREGVKPQSISESLAEARKKLC